MKTNADESSPDESSLTFHYREMRRLYVEEEERIEAAEQVEELRHRPRIEEDEQEDVPFEYLSRMFYEEFLLKEPNHLGIYFSFEKDKSRRTHSTWIGMVDPPVFYLFDEIKLEAFQRYTPTKTTEQRWNKFLFLFRLQHPREEGEVDYGFQHIVRTLKEKKFIQLVHESQSNVLDISLENAMINFLKGCGRYTEAQMIRMQQSETTKKAAAQVFKDAFKQVHALEHVNRAFCFTKEFFTLHQAQTSKKDDT